MMPRVQTGHVYKRGGSWVLRYRQTINQSGELVTVQKAVRLAPIDANHKTKKSVKELVEGKLTDINRYNRTPETVTTVGEFVNRIYLPFVVQQKRPSTARGYRDMWGDHFRSRTEDVLLRDVKCSHVQGWLETIAAEDRTKTGDRLRHETMKHLKSFVSGVFSHAKRQGFYDGVNPAENTAIPPSPQAGDTFAYSLEEINGMLMVLPEPAATIVATFAFTGGRRGEVRAMRWENYRNGAIHIESSIWEGITSPPKTKASKAPVPVVRQLAARLEVHRERLGGPLTGVMFPAANGSPINMNDILNRVMKPILKQAGIAWHGWHGFRRGLASNLNRLGVDDSVIQRILRHSNVTTTQTHYIRTVNADAVDAMNALETELCAERAPGTAVFNPTRLN
jgi:integrase